MIKLIATDLDGTLLNDSKEISKENYQALKDAHNQGIKVVLCTGRPYMAMRQFARQLDFLTDEDYFITFNGGLIHQAVDGEIVLSKTLSKEDMLLWYEEANRLDLPFNIIDKDYIYEPTSYPTGRRSWYMRQIGNVNAPTKTIDYYSFDSNHRFNKFIFAIDPDYLDQQSARIDQDLAAGYDLTRSLPHMLEVGTKGVHKGNALKKLGQTLDIKLTEMMTIGDQANDKTMIDMAGYGVAMSNAIPMIKDIADYVTDTNNNHGVAKAIYHVLGSH